jgi:hypothetical protein
MGIVHGWPETGQPRLYEHFPAVSEAVPFPDTARAKSSWSPWDGAKPRHHTVSGGSGTMVTLVTGFPCLVGNRSVIIESIWRSIS